MVYAYRVLPVSIKISKEVGAVRIALQGPHHLEELATLSNVEVCTRDHLRDLED
jgi:hypothetical protein